MIFTLDDKTTQQENDLLAKYHKAEIKIIEDFMKTLFSGAGNDEIKRKTDNFAFLLYSSTILAGFLSKINVDIPDENNIRFLLSQI